MFIAIRVNLKPDLEYNEIYNTDKTTSNYYPYTSTVWNCD